MSWHVAETQLALFITGDLPLWQSLGVRYHLGHCETCQARMETYRADRQRFQAHANQLPPGLDWDRLAAEMTANIHLGLEAGECVTPRPRKTRLLGERIRNAAPAFSWTRIGIPAGIMAGVFLLLVGSWVLNVPPSSTQSLLRSLRTIAMGGRDHIQTMRVLEDRTPTLEVSSTGIAVRENGSQLGMAQKGADPLAVSVSAQGSASAQYVDQETFQVTVTSVYVQ